MPQAPHILHTNTEVRPGKAFWKRMSSGSLALGNPRVGRGPQTAEADPHALAASDPQLDMGLGAFVSLASLARQSFPGAGLGRG